VIFSRVLYEYSIIVTAFEDISAINLWNSVSLMMRRISNDFGKFPQDYY